MEFLFYLLSYDKFYRGFEKKINKISYLTSQLIPREGKHKNCQYVLNTSRVTTLC